jgi:hypothetical protein
MVTEHALYIVSRIQFTLVTQALRLNLTTFSFALLTRVVATKCGSTSSIGTKYIVVTPTGL